jgi:glycosyltransferase involved in cell wall biosynthesis
MVEGVRIHPLKKPSTRLARLFLTGPGLFLKALRVNADLYHFHSPEIIPYALILKALGKKVIYDVHELYSLDIPEKKWLPLKGLFLALYQYFEKLSCRKFFLVLAEISYAIYYRDKAMRFEVVQNFVQPYLFQSIAMQPPKPERNTLIMVGTPAARRGLPVIFEALKILKNTGARVHFLCVGNLNKDLETLLAESEAYKEVKNQVEFTGYIPIPDAYARAAECFAGIALPEDLPNHRESYPTKLFEYMAVGLPVICSDFPINREVVEGENCGICVDPDNASDIADAIRYFQSSPIVCRDMGERGKAAVQTKYNWKTEGEKLRNVYKGLLP